MVVVFFAASAVWGARRARGARARAPPPSAALEASGASASPAGRPERRAGREAADAPEPRRALVRRAAGLGAAPRQFRLERVEALPQRAPSTLERRQVQAYRRGCGRRGCSAPLRPDLEAAARAAPQPREAAQRRLVLLVFLTDRVGDRLRGDALGLRRVGVEAVGPCLFFQEAFCCVVGHVCAALRWLAPLQRWPNGLNPSCTDENSSPNLVRRVLGEPVWLETSGRGPTALSISLFCRLFVT